MGQYPCDPKQKIKGTLKATLKHYVYDFMNIRQCDFLQKCRTWWRHQMEPFPALLALSEGNLPAQSPVTLSFDVSIGLRLNRRLSKQSSRRWFETSL